MRSATSSTIHRISNDVAAFFYNYKNLQVSEFLGNAQAYIVNAAQSRIYGLDDDFHFNLNEHFQVIAGVRLDPRALPAVRRFDSTRAGQVVGAPIYATCAGAPPPYCADHCSPGAYAYVNTSTVLHNVHMQHLPDNTANLGPRVLDRPDGLR